MFIKDITGNQMVNGLFLIVDSQLRMAKNGTRYLSMRIADRTGQLPVKVWEADDALSELLTTGKIIELQNVEAKIFKDQVQLEWDGRSSQAYRVLTGDEADYSQFLPHTPGNPKEYWNYLSGVMASITNPMYRKVLSVFFADSEFVAEFMKVPAALKRHHAYIGGLAEHTAGVVALCSAAAGYYPRVNRDLLLTGAILHDIGKVKTYRIQNGFEGTDEGKLLGHLVIGVQMVERAWEQVAGGDRLEREKLLHLLVSHHGLMEWGSPIEPLMIEACILHHADNMDAQTNKFLTIMREHQSSSEWAPFDAGLGRSIFVGGCHGTDDSVADCPEGA